MAFRFGDPGGRIYGIAGTGAANIQAHWTGVNATSTWSVSPGNGRSGGSSLRVAAAFGDQRLTKTFGAQATWGVAFGYRTSLLGTGILASFYDNATDQVDLRSNVDGTLSVTRNGVVLGTSSVAISAAAYNHLELKVVIHPSAGTVELRKNGVAIIGPLTGLNTQASANSSANVVSIGHNGVINASGNWDYDDVIFWDSQVNDANGNPDIHDFVGDCNLVWLLPTGAGTTTQFTPGAGSNFAQVNEATPDGDTTYVEDGTVGHIDTYVCADVPAGTIKSVALVHYARKTDTGSRGMKAELRSASANAAHAVEQTLGTAYQYYFSPWGSDPNNGSPIAWTSTSVNALEIGQTVSS